MIIKRNNQTIKCEVTLTNRQSIYPQFLLTTNCRGFKNSYSITTKVCGLNECSEKSLYFGVASATCLNLDNTNEETLIDEAIEDIFCELTKENY